MDVAEKKHCIKDWTFVSSEVALFSFVVKRKELLIFI